ncbi:hypothetical protein [Edaphosphingomonas haloaromaticamans]|nr:hypothetical protein [Sphingomonas haloaromaticamans]
MNARPHAIISGIVVEDLDGAIDFLRELGLELEGRATIAGE